MKTDLCLPTKAAADALGISTDTLKRILNAMDYVCINQSSICIGSA